LAAAIYSAWLGLKTLVLEANVVGGRAWMAPRIENYPGFPEGLSGSDLVEKMRQHALRFKAEFRTDEEIVGLEVQDKIKRVISRKRTYEAPVVIIATGTQRRKLRVAGETEFLGLGVSYCAICDGPFFRNRDVAVVGNTEEAAVDALALSDLARKVTIITQIKELEIEGALLSRLQSKGNIEVINAQVTAIKGTQTVKAIEIQRTDSQQTQDLPTSGVFISLGGVPLTAIVSKAGIETLPTGCLMVDRQQKTNVDGVFAAGDCTCGGMQVVTAAGEGAMAAMRASAYVRKGSAVS
jgi:thioredoxin reductase (NADPH)